LHKQRSKLVNYFLPDLGMLFPLPPPEGLPVVLGPLLGLGDDVFGVGADFEFPFAILVLILRISIYRFIKLSCITNIYNLLID
jgi:hypothetical protein